MISGAQTIAVHYWATLAIATGKRSARVEDGPATSFFRRLKTISRRDAAFLSTPIRVGGCRAVGNATRYR